MECTDKFWRTRVELREKRCADSLREYGLVVVRNGVVVKDGVEHVDADARYDRVPVKEGKRSVSMIPIPPRLPLGEIQAMDIEDECFESS